MYTSSRRRFLMKNRIIQVPVTLDSANRKKDRSVKFAFTTTREITTDEFLIMDTYHQSAGWLLFKENEFKQEEVPEEDVETDVSKSQSVQLRDALWVLFKARGNNTADKDAWSVFYKRNIQAIKSKILEEVHSLEEE